MQLSYIYNTSKLPLPRNLLRHQYHQSRKMFSSNSPNFTTLRGDLASFHQTLASSKRILALCGAGLSASSGLPTFRGAGGLWRTHDSISLATPEAFAADPGLVWQFYNYRRHMALQAQPNAAHYALAELARTMPGFQCLSQNVDGLSQRAEHPREQLQLLHGTLFDLICADKNGCGYIRADDFTDPVCPALAIPTTSSGQNQDPTSNASRHADLDISNASTPLPSLSPSSLPQCPQCKKALLRPGVVWFGEHLPFSVLEIVDSYLAQKEKIDLILVIGTSAKVYPAAGYVDDARRRGAKVAVVNMDEKDVPMGGWREGDWFFLGDAAVVVPELVGPVTGGRD